ncbi:molecular chaperone [Citrobacter amalonaticus]|uniref:fimbrial biogenesis chaperone n=1 Tax=Citrobacter amalonaticus TaxID=35703 RepID=UPI00300CC54E
MRRVNVLKTVSLLIITLCCNCAMAGVLVSGTRVVYDGHKRETSLGIKNKDSTSPYLIQTWADNDGPEGTVKNPVKPPFVITPPVFRLDAGKENMVRIILTSPSLPQDRESLYWVNVKSIPASSKETKNVLQISVKTRIKLIYRPEGIESPEMDDYKKIMFHQAGNELTVTNPTPYFITFFSLNVGNKPVTTTNIVVPPKGTAQYLIPVGAIGHDITWQVINDYGGASPVTTSHL